MKELIERLESQIKKEISYGNNLDARSCSTVYGLSISVNEAIKILDCIKKSQHGQTTVPNRATEDIHVSFANWNLLSIGLKGDVQRSYPMFDDTWKEHLTQFINDLVGLLEGKKLSELK